MTMKLEAVLLLALVVPTLAQAQNEPTRDAAYRYHFVELAPDLPAASSAFDPVALTNSRIVYGTGYECHEDAPCIVSILRYANGEFRVLREDAVVHSANELGVLAGSVITDRKTVREQAAVFYPNRVEVIPAEPEEVQSFVTNLTNSGYALVWSYSETTVNVHLWRGGRKIELPFVGRGVSQLDVNELGLVSGTFANENRGFRYNPYTSALTLLEPLPSEPISWGVAIGELGSVLGYSFGPERERIGVWRVGGGFQTWFVQGTPEFPTVSNALLWNRLGLIVVTRTSREDLESYLVPAPNVRLKIRELVRDGTLPVWNEIRAVNDRGDLLGSGGPAYFNNETNFLLERTLR